MIHRLIRGNKLSQLINALSCDCREVFSRNNYKSNHSETYVCVCVPWFQSTTKKTMRDLKGAPPFDDQRFGNPSMRVLNHHGTFNITHFRSNWVVIKRLVHRCICQPSYLHLHPNVELEHAKNTTWKTKTTTLWQSNMAIGNPRAKWRFIAGKIFINEGFPLPWKWLPEGKSMYIPSIIIKNIINLPLAFH